MTPMPTETAVSNAPAPAAPAAVAPAMSAHDLHASLGQGASRRAVLHGVSVEVPAGQWLAIVGPNGAGKSTLLQCLGGLLPCQGRVRLLGRDLADWPRRERAQRLSWLGQGGAGASTADDLTAYDIALLGRLPHRGWLGAPRAADHAAVECALRQTQAWDWACTPLGALSGGQRQRVLLSRALAVEAEVLLMDEPLANLDPPHQADWLALMRALAASGKTVVSVLHELSAALMADRMLLLHQGRVAHCGACTDPATHRALEAVFEHRIAVHRLADKWVALWK